MNPKLLRNSSAKRMVAPHRPIFLTFERRSQLHWVAESVSRMDFARSIAWITEDPGACPVRRRAGLPRPVRRALNRGKMAADYRNDGCSLRHRHWHTTCTTCVGVPYLSLAHSQGRAAVQPQKRPFKNDPTFAFPQPASRFGHFRPIGVLRLVRSRHGRQRGLRATGGRVAPKRESRVLGALVGLAGGRRRAIHDVRRRAAPRHAQARFGRSARVASVALGPTHGAVKTQ